MVDQLCIPRTPPACEISMVPRAILRTLTGRWPVLLCLPTHLVITEFVHPRSVLLCLLTDYVITEFAHFRPVLLCLPMYLFIAERARQRTELLFFSDAFCYNRICTPAACWGV